MDLDTSQQMDLDNSQQMDLDNSQQMDHIKWYASALASRQVGVSIITAWNTEWIGGMEKGMECCHCTQDG